MSDVCVAAVAVLAHGFRPALRTQGDIPRILLDRWHPQRVLFLRYRYPPIPQDKTLV